MTQSIQLNHNIITQAGTCLPGYDFTCVQISSDFKAANFQQLGFPQTNDAFSTNFLGLMFTLVLLVGFLLGHRVGSKKVKTNKVIEAENIATKGYYGSTIM